MNDHEHKIEQPKLDGLSDHELVENMSYAEREVVKADLLSRMSDYEKLVHLINEVNEVEGCDE